MRLIDAQALEKVVAKQSREVYPRYKVLGLLMAAPTIDAVEVVRCKDCKHRPTKEDEGKWSLHCPMWDGGDSGYGAFWNGEDEGFCYMGERK